MVEGIILAGGFSSRAKLNKMLLSFNGKPLIWHAIQRMKPFVDHIIVVTGYYDQEIREALKNEKNVDFVFNKNFTDGMFSSVKTGVEKTKGDFFILPGDCPFVSKQTYVKLLGGTKEIRAPIHKGNEGHPLFLKKSLKDELLREDKTSNLKIFRDRHDLELIEIDDEDILLDIDTIEDYKKAVDGRE